MAPSTPGAKNVRRVPFSCARTHKRKTGQAAEGPAGFAIDSTRRMSEPDVAAWGFTVSESDAVCEAYGGLS